MSNENHAELKRQFQNPSDSFGPVDTWWWEAAPVTREKITEQLEQLKAQGVHGTWYYPRWAGNQPLRCDPEYWFDDWWELTKFALEEHERLGLIQWAGDWTANGRFQRLLKQEIPQRPELQGTRLAVYEERTTIFGPPRRRLLEHELINGSVPAGPIVIDVPVGDQILHAAAYRPTEHGIVLESKRPLDDQITANHFEWTPPPNEEWVIVIVTAQAHDLNYLHPALADRWMDLLLGEYTKRVPEHVGKALIAYGPDEMFVLNGNILYSPQLRDQFLTQKGYDPLDYLPGLFFDIGNDTDRIRCDYHGVAAEMLDVNFYQPFADRVHDQGMEYVTIATWGRQDPLDQTFNYGSFFRMMKHFDVPGNEDPFSNEVHSRRILDSKFSSSVAHLYGRQRVAVCGYWDSGWGHTHQDNLAFTYANYTWGINHYNRHGGLHALMGGWYEWVPPAIHFHQPHWPYWHHFTDWVRRLSCIMSQGTHVADVALLYPLTTMHAGWRGEFDFSDEARAASESCMRLAEDIFQAGIDFDFIDDESICRADCTDAQLTVADIGFRCVVLPPLTTICRDTLAKLHAFHQAGGVIVAMGRLPDASPQGGRHDPETKSMIADIFGPEAGANGLAASVHGHPSGGIGVFEPGGRPQVIEHLENHIDLDVLTSDPDWFHTHQRTDDLDIYLLFNPRDEKRRAQFDLRATGNPERWDPFTGEITPLNFQQRDGRTIIEREMDIYEGLVVVIDRNADQTQRSEIGTSVVDTITIDGQWDATIQPVLNNKWGDFRYPASDTLIGPEARTFQHREEQSGDGEQASWHEPQFNDADWPTVTYSYGPYWWTLGPFNVGHEPAGLIDQINAGQFDAGQSLTVAQQPCRWSQYAFSQQFGAVAMPDEWGGLVGVQDEFLICLDVPGGRDAPRHAQEVPESSDVVRYFLTHADAPAKCDKQLHIGGRDPFTVSAWLNGEQIFNDIAGNTAEPHDVALNAGANQILLRIVQPEGNTVPAYAALADPGQRPKSDPQVPLLRWFRDTDDLLYDLDPGSDRVGWYRAAAPAGLSAMSFDVYARRVQIWIDGDSVCDQSVDCDPRSDRPGRITVSLPTPKTSQSQLAIRIESAPGRYGGAAFASPVALTCDAGRTTLGDWTDQGLATFSGAVVYENTIALSANQLTAQVKLDLGHVGMIADLTVNGSPVGVRIARPYRFDITKHAKPGDNHIAVKVVNTLANHMSSYPTKHILTGQMISGLQGPITIQLRK